MYIHKVAAEPRGDETEIVFHFIFLKFKYLCQESLYRKIDIDTFSSGYASSLSPCLKQWEKIATEVVFFMPHSLMRIIVFESLPVSSFLLSISSEIGCQGWIRGVCNGNT